jgi:pyruvate formate lyase activating enzyme
VETNGFLGTRLSDEELEKIDLVLLGIKTWGLEKHRRLTGKDIEPTLKFARRLATRRRPIWVRFVLVPGLTDDSDDLRRWPSSLRAWGCRAGRGAPISPVGPVQVEGPWA